MHNLQPKIKPWDLMYCFAFLLVAGRNIFWKKENSWFFCAYWVWCTSTLVLLCSAINTSIFLPTSINNETKAPLCVPNRTAPQQHLLIVQGILLSSKSESSCEFIQFVVWCLTFDFTCKRKAKTKRCWKSSWPRYMLVNTGFSAVPQPGNISHCSCSPLLSLSLPSYILHLLMSWNAAPSSYSVHNPTDHNEFVNLAYSLNTAILHW